MPANRSRTQGWRRSLQQVLERGGALEIAVAPERSGGDARHLVWRVRLLKLDDAEIVVEQPSTIGQHIDLERGIQLVAIMSLGQNRWMFHTENLGPTTAADGYRSVRALRLQMPENVERCQRRHHYRMETAALMLPDVEVWQLLDPKSVVVAERANELRFEADQRGGRSAGALAGSDRDLMPEVGPKFTATLINIGGGGVGVRVRPEDAQTLARSKLFWLRFSLQPGLATPICATGKLAHTNVESSHHVYAGMAFDFSFNPVHQRFVVEQIRAAIARQQAAQLGERRKTA